MRVLRTLTALTILLGASACGGDETDQTAARTTARPTAAADAPGDPGTEGDGQGSMSGRSPGTGTSATPGGPTPTPAPLPAAPPGKANPPRTGDYVYDVSGTNSFSGPYSKGARETVNVTSEGDVYTLRTSSNQPGGATTTTRTRWANESVQLLSMRIDLGARSYECVFDPPLTVLRFPLRAQTYPTQTGQGQDCETTTQIEVIGQEDTTTPAGSWKSWRIQSATDYRFGSELSGNVSGTGWFSPDLGFEVRGERQNSGTLRAQGQDQAFASTVTTSLRSHP